MADDSPIRLDEFAPAPRLSVAGDFDETLAPVVPDPALADAGRESAVALNLSSQMPRTHLAVISGRAPADLMTRTHDLENLHFVGGHESESEIDSASQLFTEAAGL